MAKTITLSDLVIKQLVIDYERQAVIALFQMKDASGTTWIEKEAMFFVTMPTLGVNETVPDTWFQLPASYIPTLVGLRDDADTALTATFLV